jgi:hypothetical protein
MKVFAILVSLIIIYIVKRKHNSRSRETGLRTYELETDKYISIQYINYKNQTIPNKPHLNEVEKKIFDIMKNLQRYKTLVFGGWVRDRLVCNEPRDLDIIVDVKNMTDLNNFNNEIFDYLKNVKNENLSNTEQFQNLNDLRNYGFGKIKLYGKVIDVLALAGNRIIVPPYV